MGLLSNLIVDFSSSFPLQYCVSVHPEDVVETANAKNLAKESTFCLRALAQLDALVCCGQELVCD